MLVFLFTTEVKNRRVEVKSDRQQKRELCTWYILLTSTIVTVSMYSLVVQETCESRGSHPGLSVLTSLLVSVDIKLY